MTGETPQQLGQKVDEKQTQVSSIIESEKRLTTSDETPEDKKALERQYAAYQRALIDEVESFQTALGGSSLEDAKRAEMLQGIVDIFLTDGLVQRGYDQSLTGDSSGEIDATNLGNIAAMMHDRLETLKPQLSGAPASAPDEGAETKKVSGTLSSIVEDKFGIAYDAGGENTKKHFAYVMALNDALGEPNRDPNTEILEEEEVDKAAIRTYVEGMNAALINEKFEAYLAFDSSKDYETALRALAEGRRVGGGGGGGGEGGGRGDEAGDGRGGEGGGRGDEAGDDRRGEGTGEISHYDSENGKVVPGWAMNVSGEPSKGFTKIEINDQTIGSLVVGSEISVVDATKLGILDANETIFECYETMFKAVLDPLINELVVGVKKVGETRDLSIAAPAAMSFEDALKYGFVTSNVEEASSQNRADYELADEYEWVSDDPSDEGYWQVKKVAPAEPAASAPASGGVTQRPAAPSGVSKWAYQGLPEGLNQPEYKMVIGVVTKLIAESAMPEREFSENPFQFEGDWIVFKKSGWSNSQIIKSSNAQLINVFNARWKLQMSEKKAQETAGKKQALNVFIAQTVDKFKDTDAENQSPFYVATVSGITRIYFNRNNRVNPGVTSESRNDDGPGLSFSDRFGDDITAKKLVEMLNNAWFAKKYGNSAS